MRFLNTMQTSVNDYANVRRHFCIRACLHGRPSMLCPIRRSIEDGRGRHRFISGHTHSSSNETQRYRIDFQTSPAIGYGTIRDVISFVDVTLCGRPRAVIIYGYDVFKKIYN